MKKQYIAYYRVSTQKQGQSGLGLEAQRQTVHSHCKNGTIVSEYTEVISGKGNGTIQLVSALTECKKIGATLVIAKLDRLSRNVGFINNLMEAGVRFQCCDMPEANELTINIFAALAQHERKLISERTKAALAAKKSLGFKLGKNNFKPDSVTKSILSRQTKNKDFYKKHRELANLYRNNGLTLQQIADKLNELDFHTINGKSFKPQTIKNLLSAGN
ncbi:recombinase family protein [Xanthocytophaga agilis]|uniref:Recombinase family protein n=1 Tax=Xanthocytophaga agilis TaxID=3048010 RepID=A0AAE3UEU4_9BACT|nr:recombinase family protein [Xanthocytophaga agilis]MDJ1500657.1 recombinase family protein [Xanthocytophaga agilis]